MPDSYADRVKRALGQLAPPSADGGRRILFRCDGCSRVWLQDGARQVLELEADQMVSLALELDADLAALPLATCRICAAQRGGQIDIDEYGAGRGGYGFSYEGPDPEGVHLMCSVLSLPYMERSARSGSIPRAGVVTDYKRCRAVISWLADLKEPRQYNPITREEAAHMARMNPPGHGAQGFRWCGGNWSANCAPMGGQVIISIAQAIPIEEPYSMALTIICWHALALRMIRAGHIAGEPEEA